MVGQFVHVLGVVATIATKCVAHFELAPHGSVGQGGGGNGTRAAVARLVVCEFKSCNARKCADGRAPSRDGILVFAGAIDVTMECVQRMLWIGGAHDRWVVTAKFMHAISFVLDEKVVFVFHRGRDQAPQAPVPSIDCLLVPLVT